MSSFFLAKFLKAIGTVVAHFIEKLQNRIDWRMSVRSATPFPSRYLEEKKIGPLADRSLSSAPTAHPSRLILFCNGKVRYAVAFRYINILPDRF